MSKPKEYYKNYRERLSTPYIKDTLKKMGVAKYQMTDLVIDLKRQEIKIHRKISKELKSLYEKNRNGFL